MAAFLFLTILAVPGLFTACSEGVGETDGNGSGAGAQLLSADLRRAGTAGADLELDLSWALLPDFADVLGPRGTLERELEFRVLIRNTGILAGRYNARFYRKIGYDPYNGIYYCSDSGGGRDFVAGTRDELKEYLKKPVRLIVPGEQIGAMGADTLEIDIRARLLRLGSDSVFRRWLVLFGPALTEAYGRIRIDWPSGEVRGNAGDRGE